MKRTLLALCAAALAAAFGFSATPATAYVGDYDYSFSKRGSDASPRAERRSARSNRATRQASRQQFSDGGSAPRTTRRSGRRVSTLASLTGAPARSGIASYYWQPQRVASGGWFNPNAMTAAHRTLPFGTRVRVTNLNNGRSVTVTINDRGPYIAGRIIDLSRAAAQVVGMTGSGIARVNVSVLGRG